MATKIMQMPCSVASNISAAIETLSNCVPADAQDHVNTDEHFEKMKRGLLDTLNILENIQREIQQHNKSESTSKSVSSGSETKSELPAQTGGDDKDAPIIKADTTLCPMSALVQVCSISQVLDVDENDVIEDQIEPPPKRHKGNGGKTSGSKVTPRKLQHSAKQSSSTSKVLMKFCAGSESFKDADADAGSKLKRDEKVKTKKLLTFEAQLGALMDFKSIYNHCNVPNKFENKSLAKFVTRMRREYRAFQDNRFDDCADITSERIKILEGVGFQWRPLKGEIHELPFRERIQMLKKFRAETGHCNVSTSFTGDKSLGRWVAMQRRGYKIFQETGEDVLYGINADRIKQLEEIGFRWAMQNGGEGCKSFEERLSDLMAFKEAHGHCNVPKTYKEDQQLANFVSKMRQAHSRFKKHGKDPRSRINADRAKMLEDIGFCWNLKLKRKEDKAKGLISNMLKVAKSTRKRKRKESGCKDAAATASAFDDGKVAGKSNVDETNDVENAGTSLSQTACVPNLVPSNPPAKAKIIPGTQNTSPPLCVKESGGQNAVLLPVSKSLPVEKRIIIPKPNPNISRAGTQSQYDMSEQLRRKQEQTKSTGVVRTNSSNINKTNTITTTNNTSTKGSGGQNNAVLLPISKSLPVEKRIIIPKPNPNISRARTQSQYVMSEQLRRKQEQIQSTSIVRTNSSTINKTNTIITTNNNTGTKGSGGQNAVSLPVSKSLPVVKRIIIPKPNPNISRAGTQSQYVMSEQLRRKQGQIKSTSIVRTNSSTINKTNTITTTNNNTGTKGSGGQNAVSLPISKSLPVAKRIIIPKPNPNISRARTQSQYVMSEQLRRKQGQIKSTSIVRTNSSTINKTNTITTNNNTSTKGSGGQNNDVSLPISKSLPVVKRIIIPKPNPNISRAGTQSQYDMSEQLRRKQGQIKSTSIVRTNSSTINKTNTITTNNNTCTKGSGGQNAVSLPISESLPVAKRIIIPKPNANSLPVAQRTVIATAKSLPVAKRIIIPTAKSLPEAQRIVIPTANKNNNNITIKNNTNPNIVCTNSTKPTQSLTTPKPNQAPSMKPTKPTQSPPTRIQTSTTPSPTQSP